jgi:hypothetical protein
MSEAAQPAEPAQSAEHAQNTAAEVELSGAERAGIEGAGFGRADSEQVDQANGAETTPTPTLTNPTTDPRVDDAVSRLSEIDGLPLTEQVEVYSDIHRRLAGVLADPDSQA